MHCLLRGNTRLKPSVEIKTVDKIHSEVFFVLLGLKFKDTRNKVYKYHDAIESKVTTVKQFNLQYFNITGTNNIRILSNQRVCSIGMVTV